MAVETAAARGGLVTYGDYPEPMDHSMRSTEGAARASDPLAACLLTEFLMRR